MQRQYSGTAGRIENCQIGVAYATPAGRTLLDRELYLPASWTEDRDRCTEAGVLAEVGIAIKPEFAETMLLRALDARVPAAWVTGDQAYGQITALRCMLDEHSMSYVLAVACNQRVHPAAGGEGRIDDAVAALDSRCWTPPSSFRRSAPTNQHDCHVRRRVGEYRRRCVAEPGRLLSP